MEAGNNLLIDEIRMTPASGAPAYGALVLVSTVLSHLFGASVGGKARRCKMGGAMADQLTHVFACVGKIAG